MSVAQRVQFSKAGLGKTVVRLDRESVRAESAPDTSHVRQGVGLAIERNIPSSADGATGKK